ncbi:carbon catabolite repressor protein 4 homolog 1-like isoform X2 [Chenopodium quinoa]|uniref:carbon catabolite repressor protein 4 homolog 1-like isoform X2 n=1 Tax=Chenopodium quinoa TaxID=63459 RepID=UPI000B78EC02|nr:carbon catabolite repressor protein 4 homolog 1-like isoform X2 [Chenopodium quinoa]
MRWILHVQRHLIHYASAYASTFPKPVNDIKRRRMKMKHSKTGEPLFTSLTSFYGSTLDYIFYTVDSLEVEGLLELPDFESVGRALPSPLWSSDHIALMGSFRITRPFLVKLQGAYDETVLEREEEN